jgi:hypothetical protein
MGGVSLLGILSAMCDASCLFSIYLAFQAAVILVEIGVAGTALLFGPAVVKEYLNNEELFNYLDNSAKMIACALLFIVVFQSLLIWSATANYMSTRLERKSTYTMNKWHRASLPGTTNADTFTVRSEFSCLPMFYHKYLTPDWMQRKGTKDVKMNGDTPKPFLEAKNKRVYLDQLSKRAVKVLFEDDLEESPNNV